LLKAAIQALAIISTKYIPLKQKQKQKQKQINSDSMTKFLDELEKNCGANIERSDARVAPGIK